MEQPLATPEEEHDEEQQDGGHQAEDLLVHGPDGAQHGDHQGAQQNEKQDLEQQTDHGVPPPSRLTRAEACCWVAWMYGRESDALLYRHPRTDEDMDEAERLRDVADAFHTEAVLLDEDPGLWGRALEKWDWKGSEAR